MARNSLHLSSLPRAISIAWLATGLTLALSSNAQTSTSDRAAAEALYDQGLRLMQEKSYDQACPKLEESQRLDPGVGTLLYLGHCYQEMERLASAWATFKEAAYVAAAAGQSDRETVALERADALKPRLAHLTIRVVDPNVEGLEVRRDGELLRSATWGVPVPIDAGRHIVEVTAPNRQTWKKSITVPSGAGSTELSVPRLAEQVSQIRAVPVVAPPATSQPKPAQELTPPATTTRSISMKDAPPGSAQRTWGWLTIGAAGAGLAVGGVFALLAAQADAEADKKCRGNDPTLCSAEGVALGDTAVSRAGVATVATGVGAALLVTGGVLLFTAPSAPRTANTATGLRAGVYPNGATLSLQGSW